MIQPITPLDLVVITELTMKIDSDAAGAVYLFAQLSSSVEPLGMLCMEIDKQGSPGWIGPLFITEGNRSHGVGTKLLEHAFEIARRFGLKTVGLTVKRTNEGARRLYDRLGFLPYLSGHEGYDQLVKVL